MGPPLGPPPLGPPPTGSGAALQDPTGYPAFHATPPPPGRAPEAAPRIAPAIAVADAPLGGFRPQIDVGPDGTRHVVYYTHEQAADILWYRTSRDGRAWSAPEQVSGSDGRNWGPDLVVRDDGRVFVVWDRAEPDMRARGWIRERGPEGWAEPIALTEDGAYEVGSGHIAVVGDDVVYVYIGKPLGMQHRFRAFWRWRRDGRWSAPEAFSDGRSDAWHTNVQARPDGSVLAGYDLGNGGSETTTYVVDGRDGRFGPPEDVSATSRPGERVHFAFHPGGGDWLAWFHKVRGLPLHVYARGGRPGAWSAVDELSAGYGGYHYDPFLTMAPNGTLAAVWGWDGGDTAELVYSVRRDAGWSAPMRAAALDDGKPELPSMDVDAAGRFHVVWANGVRGRTRVWYTTIDP